MGAREPCRRLEAVLGALYDLGEEPGDGGEEVEEESKEPAAAAAAGGGGEGGGGGRAAGGQRGARGFFEGLREELRNAAPPPAAPQPVEVVLFRGGKRRPLPPHGGPQAKAVAEKKTVKEQEFNFEKICASCFACPISRAVIQQDLPVEILCGGRYWWKQWGFNYYLYKGYDFPAGFAREFWCSGNFARLEVHKFGITGYQKQEQRLWERERAIMLGAKPSKKQHINYKEYQEKMKEKKAAKEDDKEKEHKGDSLKKKKKKDLKERKAKRKKSVPSIWAAGQVGKFRDGTLILQSGDIKKIKSSKVVK